MSIRPEMNMFDQILRHAGHKLIAVARGVRGEEYSASIECLSCDEVLVDTVPSYSRTTCSESEIRTYGNKTDATVSWDDTDWSDSLRTMVNGFKNVSATRVKPCCERDIDGDGDCDRHHPFDDSWVQGYIRWRRSQPGQS